MAPTTSRKRQHHCLDIWAISNDTLHRLSSEKERAETIRRCVRSSDGPFAPNSLDHQAPLTFAEEALAIFLLLIPMGGPLLCLFSTIVALILGSNLVRLITMIIFAFLAFHPMPTSSASDFSRSFMTSRYTNVLYRYFTYRFVWTDDNFEAAQTAAPWIGAGPPHGVLPFANILSIPAINTISNIKFVGGPANVVFHTPFLRYFTLYPSTPVGSQSIAKSIAAGTCVGIVPDGIAGIFHQSEHIESVALQHRKGLARHALRYGTTILPAYSFGNTRAFGAWWDRFGILKWMSRKAQASVFLYWGRFGLPIPRRVQISMVIGAPITVEKASSEPTEEQILEVHTKILAGIRDCFESHRDALGWGDKELVFE